MRANAVRWKVCQSLKFESMKSINDITVRDFLFCLYRPLWHVIYDFIHDYRLTINPKNFFFETVAEFDEYSKYSFTKIEIYNYMEKLTSGFDKHKCNLFLSELHGFAYDYDPIVSSVIYDDFSEELQPYQWVELEERLKSASELIEFVRQISGENTQDEETVKRKPDVVKVAPILKKAQEAGFLDESYMPIKGKMTKIQMKLFAAYCAVACNITERHWKFFEELWNIKGLQGAKEEQGSDTKAKAVVALFPSEVVAAAKERFNLLV